MKKGAVSVLSMFIGSAVGAGIVRKVETEKIEKIQSMSNKHLALFLMMNQWVKVKQEGKNLALCFEQRGYQRIAVYGMNYVGETLLDELKGSRVQVAYGIDKNAERIYTDVEVVVPEGPFDKVDAVIVTAITYFDEIKEMLEKKMHCPVISLEDILYEA